MADEWADLLQEFKAEGFPVPCFATEGCRGILVPWHIACELGAHFSYR
jgi:hypothetical protein